MQLAAWRSRSRSDTFFRHSLPFGPVCLLCNATVLRPVPAPTTLRKQVLVVSTEHETNSPILVGKKERKRNFAQKGLPHRTWWVVAVVEVCLLFCLSTAVRPWQHCSGQFLPASPISVKVLSSGFQLVNCYSLSDKQFEIESESQLTGPIHSFHQFTWLPEHPHLEAMAEASHRAQWKEVSLIFLRSDSWLLICDGLRQF